ncbi:hypothetical protein V9056_10795 [Streptococcus agalactiae]|uniref:hypothetical protein n=1 Tax=Streptococcus agalactiae TaxID=1311 RepID=UPI00300F9B27
MADMTIVEEGTAGGWSKRVTFWPQFPDCPYEWPLKDERGWLVDNGWEKTVEEVNRAVAEALAKYQKS